MHAPRFDTLRALTIAGMLSLLMVTTFETRAQNAPAPEYLVSAPAEFRSLEELQKFMNEQSKRGWFVVNPVVDARTRRRGGSQVRDMIYHLNTGGGHALMLVKR